MGRFLVPVLGGVLTICTVGSATAQSATCAIAGAGARCVSAPGDRVPFPYEPGSTLPRGEFRVMLNTEYYGLPPSDGSFWYFKVENRILKVHPGTLEVLEDATWLANRAY